jgi:hypothetical protein
VGQFRVAKSTGTADESEDLNADVDTAVLACVRQPGRWYGPFDLIFGLVGVGLYFLERLPSAAAIEALSLVVRHLESMAEPGNPGITWHTGPALLPDWQRELCPSDTMISASITVCRGSSVSTAKHWPPVLTPLGQDASERLPCAG